MGPARARGGLHRAGVGGSRGRRCLGAWGGCGAVAGLCGAQRGVGTPCHAWHPGRARGSARPHTQAGAAGQETGTVRGCFAPLGSRCAAVLPRSPCPALGAALLPRRQLWVALVGTGAAVGPWPGPGRLVLSERAWGWGRSCAPLVLCPAGAAVPGGGRAGARPGGAVLRAVPAPAQCHGGALWAAGRLPAGAGSGLRGGFAAALLPRRPACESRERGAGAPGAGWGGLGASCGREVSWSPPSHGALPWTVPNNCGCAAPVTA